MDKNYIERNQVYQILEDLKNEEIDLEHAFMRVDFLPAMREIEVNASVSLAEADPPAKEQELRNIIFRKLEEKEVIELAETELYANNKLEVRIIEASLKVVVPEYHNAF